MTSDSVKTGAFPSGHSNDADINPRRWPPLLHGSRRSRPEYPEYPEYPDGGGLLVVASAADEVECALLCQADDGMQMEVIGTCRREVIGKGKMCSEDDTRCSFKQWINPRFQAQNRVGEPPAILQRMAPVSCLWFYTCCDM